MHRRARHLNPKDAGAVAALDARFLSGFNDGDGIGTWTSRTNTNSPTQATAANKPIYKVNIQGGCPAAIVDDTASSVGRFMTWSTTPISGATAASFIYSVKRTSDVGSGSPVVNFGTANPQDHDPYGGGTSAYLSLGSSSRQQFNAVSINTPTIQSITSKSGEWTVRRVGTQIFTTATNTVGIGSYPRIGSSNNTRPNGGVDLTGYYWIGQIFCVNVFNLALADSLRRRIEHSIGYSFKIASN